MYAHIESECKSTLTYVSVHTCDKHSERRIIRMIKTKYINLIVHSARNMFIMIKK